MGQVEWLPVNPKGGWSGDEPMVQINIDGFTGYTYFNCPPRTLNSKVGMEPKTFYLYRWPYEAVESGTKRPLRRRWALAHNVTDTGMALSRAGSKAIKGEDVMCKILLDWSGKEERLRLSGYEAWRALSPTAPTSDFIKVIWREGRWVETRERKNCTELFYSVADKVCGGVVAQTCIEYDDGRGRIDNDSWGRGYLYFEKIEVPVYNGMDWAARRYR